MLSPPLDATQSWACWSHAVPRWTSMGGGLRRRDRLTGGCLRPGVTAVSPPAWGSHVRGGGRPRGVLGVRRGRGVQPEGGAASREWSWRPRGSLQGGVRTAPRVCRVASNSAALRGGVSSQHTVHRGISSAFSEPGSERVAFLGPACGPLASQRQGQNPTPHPGACDAPPRQTRLLLVVVSTRFVVEGAGSRCQAVSGRGAGAGSMAAVAPCPLASSSRAHGVCHRAEVAAVCSRGYQCERTRGQEGPRVPFLGVNVRVYLE